LVESGSWRRRRTRALEARKKEESGKARQGAAERSVLSSFASRTPPPDHGPSMSVA
jgi:hypothetical protein